MVTTFTVLQVAEHIDRQVREVWDSQFWVRGEVAGLKRTNQGRVYFDLVHTGDRGEVRARLGVSMPPAKVRLVDRRLAAVGQPLADGLEIRIKANLSFWVGGGRLSLDLADIDPAHTAGALAVARRELLDALAADGSLTRNATLPVPRVPLSLGLVTSGGSQAFHDVTDELRQSGLPFTVSLVSTKVQGPDAPNGIVAALRQLGRLPGLDLVLLSRGGGAEVDLVTFDHPAVARAIADHPLPVWTGIGHHQDTPVAELVAARSFKTPTALAQGVVGVVGDAVRQTEATWASIRAVAHRRLAAADHALVLAARRTSAARGVLRAAKDRVHARDDRLRRQVATVLARTRDDLDTSAARLAGAAPAALRDRRERLDRAARLLDLADPDRLIAKGWSLTTMVDDGQLVTGPVPAGTVLATRTRGGTITSEVIDPDD